MTRVLLDSRGEKVLLSADEPMIRLGRRGVVRRDTLGPDSGHVVRVGNTAFLVLEASTPDLLEVLPRKAQVIGAKDAARILLSCDVRAGKIVVEAGLGSGHLAIALARAVSPGGRVVSYERRPDFVEFATRNLRAAEVEGIVTVRQANISDGVAERDVDALVLDLPDPWTVVRVAHTALRASGHFAAFSPNTEQVRETVRALRELPFAEIRTVEILEREIEVRDTGVRPSFAALGHTGYLTFARKVIEKP